MSSLRDSYNRLRSFVDNFANSSTGDSDVPRVATNREAWYAEWDDNYLGDLLDNTLIRTILRHIADTYYGEQLDALLEEATALTADAYPSMYEVYTHCCDTLGMYTPPEAYVTSRMRGINALSLEVDEKQLILISPRVATCLPSDEQTFLLGHELGHHQQGNLVCHTVNGLLDSITDASAIIGPLILDTVEVPLKRWCRRSEFNADRAGYLCSRNPDAVQHLFHRLGMRQPLSAYAEYQEIASAHPLLPTRWATLQEYIQSTNSVEDT